MQFNHWIISTRYENAFWINAASSVIKHERNVTKISQIPAVGLFHTGRRFGFIFVLTTVSGGAFGGHVADIFHLFCFWPNPWHGQAIQKEIMSHLCWARALCREKAYYGLLIIGRAGLHSRAFFGLWCCSAVLTGLLGLSLKTFLGLLLGIPSMSCLHKCKMTKSEEDGLPFQSTV